MCHGRNVWNVKLLGLLSLCGHFGSSLRILLHAFPTLLFFSLACRVTRLSSVFLRCLGTFEREIGSAFLSINTERLMKPGFLPADTIPDCQSYCLACLKHKLVRHIQIDVWSKTHNTR